MHLVPLWLCGRHMKSLKHTVLREWTSWAKNTWNQQFKMSIQTSIKCRFLQYTSGILPFKSVALVSYFFVTILSFTFSIVREFRNWISSVPVIKSNRWNDEEKKNRHHCREIVTFMDIWILIGYFKPILLILFRVVLASVLTGNICWDSTAESFMKKVG